MDTPYVLEASHLKCSFGSIRAVEDVSLHIRKGEIFGFLGPNGAGKTTTISMLLGLTYPTAGEVKIFGERITPLRNHGLRRVGAMVGGEGMSLMMAFSAYQHLRCMAYLRPDLPLSRLDEVLERVGLRKEDAHRPVHTFSTGMKQRLGLALALLNRPELLILDEPTNGMDPAGMHEVRSLLSTLRDEGITVFLSSHLLHEMQQICDRVAVVRQGQILVESTVSELLKGQSAVRVRTADLEQVMRLLCQLPEAHSVQIREGAVEAQGVSSEVVLVYLMKHGIVPQEVSMAHPDLESVFLQLTQATA